MEAGKAKILGPRDSVWGLMRTYFLAHRRHLLAMSSAGGRGRELSLASFIRALIPFMKALASGHNHLAEAPHLFLIPSSRQLGFQQMKFSDHSLTFPSSFPASFLSFPPLPFPSIINVMECLA